jgi:hypothetical protein
MTVKKIEIFKDNIVGWKKYKEIFGKSYLTRIVKLHKN